MNDERAETEDYFKEKEEGKNIVSLVLHAHNNEMMIRLGN